MTRATSQMLGPFLLCGGGIATELRMRFGPLRRDTTSSYPLNVFLPKCEDITTAQKPVIDVTPSIRLFLYIFYHQCGITIQNVAQLDASR